MHFIGTEPDCSTRRVDSSVPSAYDDNLPANCQIAFCFVRLDEREGIDDAREVLARNVEFEHCAEADAEKNGSELFFKACDGGFAGDFVAKAEFNAQRANHFNFAKAIGRA